MTQDATTKADPAVRARLTELIAAGWSTQVIHVAARLRLAELMAKGPKSAADLAVATGSDPDALFRLLRGLAALGVVRQLGGDRFELDEAGELLRGDAPGSVRGMALHWGVRLWGAMGQLDQSVKTGKAWTASGMEGFAGMANDAVAASDFHQSMADGTVPVARALAAAYDFSRFTSVMDVGGSYGALLAELLKADPALTGASFDLPFLAEDAGAWLERAGVADRGRFVGGDFFEAVPSGYDAYLLKFIIHDWNDEPALAILRNCRKALPAGGLVLLAEIIAPETVVAGAAENVAIRGDLVMLTAAGGRERTEAQYRDLLARAGLKLTRVTPTGTAFSLIEARAS